MEFADSFRKYLPGEKLAYRKKESLKCYGESPQAYWILNLCQLLATSRGVRNYFSSKNARWIRIKYLSKFSVINEIRAPRYKCVRRAGLRIFEQKIGCKKYFKLLYLYVLFYHYCRDVLPRPTENYAIARVTPFLSYIAYACNYIFIKIVRLRSSIICCEYCRVTLVD